MAGLDWYEAGRQAGREIAETGGSVANAEIATIGFELGRSWLNGVLDALRDEGLDATMISVSPSLLTAFRETDGWQDDGTYRGAHIIDGEEVVGESRVVVAA